MKKIPCPDTELLSAYFDKEAELTDEQEQHIANCPECQALLQSFAELDGMLKEFVRHIPTGDTGTIILSAVHARLEQEVREAEALQEKERKFNIIYWLPRIAALILLSTAFLYLMHENGYFPQDAQDSATAQTENHIGTATAQLAAPAHPTPNDVKMVGYVWEKEPVFTMNKVLYPDAKAILSPVNHAWVSTLPRKNVETMIRKICKKIGAVPVFENRGNEIELYLSLTAKQLVAFVRECQTAEGLRLISAQQPQPEQPEYLGSASDPVHYAAKFALPVTDDQQTDLLP